jgi:hypothetical protein
MRNELVGPAKSRSEPCEDTAATLTRLMMAGASAPPGTAINALNPAVVHHSKMDRPTSELGHLLPSRRRAESVVAGKRLLPTTVQLTSSIHTPPRPARRPAAPPRARARDTGRDAWATATRSLLAVDLLWVWHLHAQRTRCARAVRDPLRPDGSSDVLRRAGPELRMFDY